MESHLLDSQLLELLSQFSVLAPHATKVEVVMPQFARAVLNRDQAFFKGRDNRCRPQSHQPRGATGIALAADLYGQAKHLRKQDRHQDGDIAVALEHGIHWCLGLRPLKSKWLNGVWPTAR